MFTADYKQEELRQQELVLPKLEVLSKLAGA